MIWGVTSLTYDLTWFTYSTLVALCEAEKPHDVKEVDNVKVLLLSVPLQVVSLRCVTAGSSQGILRRSMATVTAPSELHAGDRHCRILKGEMQVCHF